MLTIKWLMPAVFLAMLSLESTADAGGKSSNGGDAAFCQASAESIFSGYYALDWLVSYRLSNANQDIVAVSTWDVSQDRIKRIIHQKLPEFAASWDNFSLHLGNQDDFTAKRIWVERAFGLVDLPDEFLISKLPSNCYAKSPSAEPQIIQAVRREAEDGMVTYYFDPSLYEHFRTTQPLQFSFLMVHEWLWDLTEDAEVIRNVNRLLHSQAADVYTPEQLKTAVKRLGIKVQPGAELGFVPVCERSRLVKQHLELLLVRPCSEIGAEQLLGLTALDFKQMPPGPLQPGDFLGLNNLTDLTLSGLELTELPPGIFSYLPKLKKLNLNANKLRRINRDIFGRHFELNELDLSFNPLERLELGYGSIKKLGLNWTAFSSDDDMIADDAWINTIEMATSSLRHIRFNSNFFLRTFSLSLKANNLQDFSCGQYSYVTKLSIVASGLSKLTKEMLSGCINIKSIRLLTGPSLTVDPQLFQANKELEVVDFGGNNWQSLPEGLFDGLKNLQELFLSGNKFDHTLPRLLPAGHPLKFLMLSDNNFSYVPGWFKDLRFDTRSPRDITFYLVDNPLNDTTVAWLKQQFAGLGKKLVLQRLSS